MLFEPTIAIKLSKIYYSLFLFYGENMKILNCMEIQAVAGGKSELTALEVGSMMTVSTLFSKISQRFFIKYDRFLGVADTIITPLMFGMGLYVGYQAAQYYQDYQTSDTETA